MYRKLIALAVPVALTVACGGNPAAPTASAPGNTAVTGGDDAGRVQAMAVDCASFVSENYPDYTYVSKNTTIHKTWRIKNCGTKAWTTSYKLWLVSGNTCGSGASGNLSSSVPPGTIANLWADCKIGTASQYQATFSMRNAAGQNFPSQFWLIVNTY